MLPLAKYPLLFQHPNLQALYEFKTGQLTTDSKGANTLTNNNSVGEAVGLFGTVADFGSPNTNKYFSRSANYGITQYNSPFTLMGWFKLLSEISTGTYGLLYRLIYPGTNAMECALKYEYNGGTRRLVASRYKNNPESSSSINYNVALGTTLWNHIAYTYDGTTMRLLLNGVDVANGAGINGTGGAFGSDIFWIGSVGAYLAGQSGDVAVFNAAISAADILKYVNSVLPSGGIPIFYGGGLSLA